MQQFVIEGSNPLAGEIPVLGAKNSSDKCLAAALLTEETCVIHNLPEIEDVKKLLQVFREMGVSVKELGNRSVELCAKDIDPTKVNQKLVGEMRFSVLLFGALLARFGEVTLASPGGDKIGARQIQTHLSAFEKLGATVSFEGGYHKLHAKELVGTKIVLDEFSPTATVNALLAACFARGKTIIKNAAAEPHIDNVMALMNAMGGKLRWVGNHIIEIEGQTKLHGAEHTINPDYLEMWTFAVLAAVTRSALTIRPFNRDYLELEMLHFEAMGAKFREEGDALIMERAEKFIAPKLRISTMPFPGFAADNLPPFAVLATQAEGTTHLNEWMYEGRQKYVNDLVKMGATAEIIDPHRFTITGPTPLHGNETTSYDIRAGVTLILAALLAEGKSVVTNAEQVDRGYERIEERLRTVGAHIQRVEV